MSIEHDFTHIENERPVRKLERGEVTLESARQSILSLGQSQGREIDIYDLFARMAADNAGADSKAPLVERVRQLKREGYATGIITNNVADGSSGNGGGIMLLGFGAMFLMDGLSFEL